LQTTRDEVCFEGGVIVFMIGFFTMGGLVWVLAFCMAGESDAERRRVTAPSGHGVPPTEVLDVESQRQAA
jgi:hypothetical protein